LLSLAALSIPTGGSSSRTPPRGAHLAAENLFLRKQLASYVERQVRPKRTDNATRVALVARETLACDFFVVLTATFRVVYVFLVLDIAPVGCCIGMSLTIRPPSGPCSSSAAC